MIERTALPDSPTGQGIEQHERERRWVSLLHALAEEPGSPLVEVSPGRFYIRKGLSADQLDQERPDPA